MRATERTREQALAHLREGYACGQLHTGTFAFRVERALGASTQAELGQLTADLPAAAGGRLRRAAAAVRETVRGTPRPPSLLEATGLRAGCLTFGRAPDCDLVLSDDTVSRRHAALRTGEDGRWFLRDLGSTNGTWVNDRRIYDAEVCPGDAVRLGELAFRL